MKTLILAAAGATTLASASPAAIQTMDHSQHMPGMAMPAPAARPKATPRRAASKAAALKAPKPAAPSTPRRSPAATGNACPPEHAAMGHCTPATRAVPTAPAAAPPPARSSAGAANTSCPPEHAAMGHCTPKSAPPAVVPAAATADPKCPPEHAAMGNCVPQASPRAERSPDMGTGGTALPAGNEPAPAAPDANYADRVWGRDAMAPARDVLRSEHGGMSFSQLMLNIAEVQFRGGRDGYRWDGEFWYGGDINRLTIKSEGEGTFREDAEGEVQALYSRAIGPYFNLQAGVRQAFARGPDRTYATIGFEGLAPYWFDVEGAIFLSGKGDLLGRLEGYYDQRITQRLILQPRVELNLSAQDVRSGRLGSGLTDAEAGLRLRYEFTREFAPYVGASWERRLGDTAQYSRAAGERTGGFSLVAGLRAWF